MLLFDFFRKRAINKEAFKQTKFQALSKAKSISVLIDENDSYIDRCREVASMYNTNPTITEKAIDLTTFDGKEVRRIVNDKTNNLVTANKENKLATVNAKIKIVPIDTKNVKLNILGHPQKAVLEKLKEDLNSDMFISLIESDSHCFKMINAAAPAPTKIGVVDYPGAPFHLICKCKDSLQKLEFIFKTLNQMQE